MNGLASIPAIIEHVRGKFSRSVFVGQDYSVADQIIDLQQIERDRAQLERDAKHLAVLIGKQIPVAELSPQETIERLRAHVRQRGTPVLENGAWVLMLHAADLIEGLILIAKET